MRGDEKRSVEQLSERAQPQSVGAGRVSRVIQLNTDSKVCATKPVLREADWQLADPLAGGREDRVRNSRRRAGCRGFTNATWVFLAGHDVNFHHRHLVDTEDVVLVKVLLLDAAAI